ncbi:LysR family transcriptional regulator [Paracoccus sp. Z118]|uniref:LysR substrate-binding domain-containing protein n=1 Tax=Paracoccus sp. Z118 TaxID=2851017 RepID=UPI001C2C6438|nr:LysR substrate-binding domain-containing protein [Paracoccus sp. Z118]MBV0890713.1 LysR family transcriptional regulator [Paracoccus sp. Z118]
MHHLPPLSAVRAFEAAARHLSFTAAAGELGMTQAGVSYQIRILEERLGGRLFLRKPRGLELTALGQRLAPATREAFDMLRSIYAHDGTGPETLSISTLPTFAGNWLSQRLAHFQTANPGLSVRLDASDALIDFAREDFDLAIRYGMGDWPGLTAHHLFDVDFTPMLSPELARRHGPLTEPAQIMSLHRLAPADPAWDVWLAAAGLPRSEAPPGPVLQLGTQIHEARAAVAAEGVALLTPRFFRFELATGALVQPFPILAANGRAYWLVYPPARRNLPAIRAFRRFLQAEIAAEAETA